MKTKLITILIISILIPAGLFSQKPLQPVKALPKAIVQQKVNPTHYIRQERVMKKDTRDDHCEEGYVDDCFGNGDCCPESWIGDGFPDCPNTFGCDLSCYDNDGGDCCGDNSCDIPETEASCPEDCTDEGSETCEDCLYDYTPYGSECCDTAWEEYSINCETLESNYSWDCEGCNCPGDVPPECGDGDCNGDETYETCPDDCDPSAECDEGYVTNCDVMSPIICCPESFIGDGYPDCSDTFGCNLTCYDCDGGDCPESDPGCSGTDPYCGDGNCDTDESYETCPEDCQEGSYCGDGVCGDDEYYSNCPDDCTDEACSSCLYDFTDYGSPCCDTACYEYGLDCATLESVYNWDCSGCNCQYPCGDNGGICGDGYCASDESFDTCPQDCLPPGECQAGEVADCADDDCCNESWIGDGYADCSDQIYGCDLTCYENDGGDCDYHYSCGDGWCAWGMGEDPDSCPEDCNGHQIGDYCVFELDLSGIIDCSGLCRPIDGSLEFGDDDCESDSPYFADYNCAEFGYECGDCNFDWDGTDPLGFCGEDCPEGEVEGDVTSDGETNVLDIVWAVNLILSGDEPTFEELCTLDLNGDGNIDILDIVLLVNLILGIQDDTYIINTGTSFGECWGYCNFDLHLEDLQGAYQAYGWGDDPDYPELYLEESISADTWNAIIDGFDFETFQDVPNILGCPDCADGGAEWIEVFYEGQSHKVTFEYYETIPGFENMVLELRALRQSFQEQMFP